MSEEQFEREDVLKWLGQNGWEIKNGEEEPFIGTKYDRQKNEAIYWDLLEQKIKQINDVGNEEYEYIKTDLKSDLTRGESLLESNKNAVNRLRSGGSYTYDNQSKTYKIIDFDNIDRNEFIAVNQFEFRDSDPYRNRRPDIVLFINGLPVCVVELKSITSANSTTEAINQLTNTYEREIPELFTTNIYNIAMNQAKLRYGAVGSSNEHYHYWKDNDKEIVSDVQSHFTDLIDKSRILEILQDYTFFKQISGKEKYAKIVPRHQQYFSTKEIVQDVLESEKKDTLGKHLIVHVQGSGKSYAMMYAANILARRHNYPVYIIVDERELVKQFGNELAKIEEISETVIRSDKGKESGSEQLKRVVNSGESGVILSILHLFNELDDEVKLEGTPVVLADEAHRFLGDILGSQMQSTLEPFHYYGYTGTPIEETYEMFSTEDELYLHRYSMSDGVNEGAILPVNMVSKKDKIQWIVNEDQMNEQLEERLKNRPEDQKRRIIYDVMSTQKIAGINSRMDLIVDDIVKHFTTKVRSGGIDYKGMVVTKGKENAAEYGKRLIEELGEDSVDVIYSADNSDSKKVQDFHKDDEEMGDVIDSFKEDKNPKILIVCEMLRTGFDAPILKTIYLDRRFSGGHTLLQTIARTNRPLTVEHEETNEKSEKMYGEIIDYQGITEEFDSLVEYDTAEIEKFTSENKEKFKQEFKEKLNSLNDYFSDELEYNLDESSLNGTEHPVLNEREDIVVVSDGPYSPKDKNLALNLRTALPNSSQIAFTATPIDEINENVMTELFGEASYIMDKEVDDGVTAEIDYEKRTSEINVDDENLNYTEYESDNKVFEKVEHMIKQNERKNKIVDDIISHFNNREIAGKAMLVAYDRETAAHYEDIFRDMAENSDMKVPEVHAIISSPEDYHEKIKRFEKRGGSIRRKGSYPSDMKNYFKDKNSNFDIAIVCDKWTTRFNAEHLHTMYLDKPMRGHNLIQTLSRINRLDDEKESGLVVDYLGIEETVKRVFSDNINEYSQD